MSFYLVMNFSFDPENIDEPFSNSYLIGKSIIARSSIKLCFDYFLRDTLVDLVDPDMVDFYVILGMD